MSKHSHRHEEPSNAASLEEAIGYTFQDRTLLERALMHSSAATEEAAESNQTLEFLGDAVLDLATSELIMRQHPGCAEGELTRMRAALVSARGLSHVARQLDLGRWVRLGKGEARSGGKNKARILADSYEAVVAAVFLDGGYPAARAVVERTFADQITNAVPSGTDYKTELQELTQRLYRTTPTYTVLSVSGPDHQRHYQVAIRLGSESLAQGEGPNRKSAEQMAAQAAVAAIKEKSEA
ncbi:MAG TPA: ribonuclease III [Candidatus Binatia bacterium]|nr:ribonuclease III [Candidatus Binatia bacterium]